jgi:uncharacterized repeat protein (TIGR03803 family)
MPRGKVPIWLVVIFVVISGFLATMPQLFAGSKEKVLHSFSGGDGLAPYAGLIFGSDRNLYGTTYSGGAYGYGNVFQLTPGANHKWTETVLYSFDYDSGGVLPTAGLIFDSAGNLFGTTKAGGVYGYGVVFQLTPGTNGKWTESVLHSFNGNDGLTPYAGLIFDAAANLYGTTVYGGDFGYGTVFQLVRGANNSWSEAVLYSFAGNPADGAYPYGGVAFDAAGNLYGTTYSGGTNDAGIVFQLTPGKGGNWTEKVLHGFGNGKDGTNPYAGLVVGAKHTLFGTTYAGGAQGLGAVFELAPGAKGRWKETLLHSFKKGKDASHPYGGLVFDVAGNLYGTTYSGGLRGYGAVFRLSPGANGKWAEKILLGFDLNDGNGPYASLIFDAAGNLYGTTAYGGGSGCGGFGCGVVFEVVP